MGYKLVKHLEAAQYNRKLFYLDNRGREDLPPIIGTSTENKTKNAFNFTKNEVQPGSECRVLSSSDKYILNTEHEWIQVREPMQEYLAALEEKFFLFFGNLIQEIKVQGEANKKAIDDLREQMQESLELLTEEVEAQGIANKNAIDALRTETQTQGVSNRQGLDNLRTEVQTQGVSNKTGLDNLNTSTQNMSTNLKNGIDSNTTAITTQGQANKTGLDNIANTVQTLTTKMIEEFDETQVALVGIQSTMNNVNTALGTSGAIRSKLNDIETATNTTNTRIGDAVASPAANTVQARLASIATNTGNINTNAGNIATNTSNINTGVSGTNTRLGNTGDAAGTNSVIGQLKRIT
jgi:uncharacterized protein YggU (UPF0235/DUF167 family)